MTAIVLHKREVENYLPGSLLDRRSTHDTYISWRSLSRAQQDHYDMKYGFGADSATGDATIHPAQRALYDGTNPWHLKRLTQGFGKTVGDAFSGVQLDLDELAQVSRLNSSGVPMAADQMVSALTYREGEGAFDLASRISDILEELASLNFGGIDRSAVLRAIAGVAGIKVHGKPGQQVANFLLADQFTPESRELLVQKASTGLVGAARWLVEQGVRCARLLPYALQIVMLAQFFGERQPTPGESSMLRTWLFATSFSGWFAGGNTTQINEDLAEMEEFQRGELPVLKGALARARPFPERYDSKSARVRAFLVATLVRLDPLRRVGEPVDVVALFPTDDIAAVPKVFPRAPTPIVSAPANRILLPNDQRGGVRRQLLELQNHCSRDEFQAVLHSHGIDEAAFRALGMNDAAAFVAARTKYLISIERELMTELNLLPPERDIEDAALDADT